MRLFIFVGLSVIFSLPGCGGGDATAVEQIAQGPPGPAVSGDLKDNLDYPVWRRNAETWQWIRIPGSDLSSIAPVVRVPGNLRNRIDAWSGLAADRQNNRVFSAGSGGHADYAGNEVYQITLSDDAPSWVTLREPSLPEHIVASNASKGIFNDYYLDGRPSSTHTYYALNYLSKFNAIFKFGAGSIWGTGNESNWKLDVFSLAVGDWMPAGTWPDVIPGERRDASRASICINTLTEQVYIAGRGLRRFDPVTGTFAVLNPRWPNNSTAVTARGCAVDTRRNRIVYFGDGYNLPDGGFVYDIAENKLSKIIFSGDGVAEITAKISNFGWYDPVLDMFLIKTRVGDSVYKVHPENFRVEKIATTGGEGMPDAVNGVQTRWQHMPRLGGYAYYARYGDGFWFLVTE